MSAGGRESQEPAPAPGPGRGLVAAVLLTSFLAPFMGSSVNVALPAIGREFGLGAIGLSWVPLAYMLPAAALLVPAGRLGDMRGRRLAYLLGAAVFSLACLFCALPMPAAAFLAVRVVQGAGAAAIFAASMAVLVAATPPAGRGRMLGLNTTAVYLGLVAGPSLGGLLVQAWGWRSVFVLGGSLGLLGLVALRRTLPRDADRPAPQPFDATGAVLYGAALAALMYGFSTIATRRGQAAALAGGLLFAAFLVLERRAAAPLLELRLFLGNRMFALSCLAALIQYSATFAVGFLMSLYLQAVRGMSPLQAGLLLMTQPVMMALLSPLSGAWSDRVEPRVPATIGQLLSAGGLFLLSFLAPATPLPHLLCCLVLLGSGFALFSTPNNNAAMGSVERRDYGAASAFLHTMRLSGQMLSVGISALALSAHVGTAALGPDTTAGFMAAERTALLVFAVLSVLGALASTQRGRRTDGRPPAAS